MPYKKKLKKLCLTVVVTLGNHSLYISFDTSEGLTLMEGTNQSDSDALVLGRVYNIISLTD